MERFQNVEAFDRVHLPSSSNKETFLHCTLPSWCPCMMLNWCMSVKWALVHKHSLLSSVSKPIIIAESCPLDFTLLYHVSCQLDATTWLAAAIFNTQYTHLFHCITCSSQCLPDGRKANNNPLAQLQLFLQFLKVYVRCVLNQALEELRLFSKWTDRRRYRQTYLYISLCQHSPSSFAFLCISKPWLDRVCMMFQQNSLNSALLAASVLNYVSDGAGSSHVNECLVKVF